MALQTSSRRISDGAQGRTERGPSVGFLGKKPYSCYIVIVRSRKLIRKWSDFLCDLAMLTDTGSYCKCHIIREVFIFAIFISLLSCPFVNRLYENGGHGKPRILSEIIQTIFWPARKFMTSRINSKHENRGIKNAEHNVFYCNSNEKASHRLPSDDDMPTCSSDLGLVK